MRTLGFIGLAGLLGCLAATPALANTVAGNAAPASIRVVSDNNYPPYLFLDANGKPQGYEVDKWTLFEAHTGIKVDLEPMNWAAAQQALLSGRADVIDMIYQTRARDPLYDFSTPYASHSVSIYVDRRIHGVYNVATLRGLSVGVEHGDACDEQLKSQGITDLRGFSDYHAIIEAATQGDLRVFCMDEDPADYYLHRYSANGRFYKAFVLYTGHLRMAVRKGNTSLLTTVERGMAKITPAERVTLRERWLDQPVVLWPYLRAARIALAAILVVAVLVALWLWLLHRTVTRRTRDLRAQQSKLRAVFDASPDAMTVKDRKGVYVDCNERALEHFGVTRDQLLGRGIGDVADTPAGTKIRSLDADLFATGQSRTAPVSFDYPDGSTHHFEITKVPVPAADGVPEGILTVARDVTAREHTEHELRLAAAAFETQEAMLVTDAHTVIQRVNDACVRLTGYAPAELVGQSTTLLRSPQHDTDFYRQVHGQVQATGLWQGEQWMQGKQGEPKPVHMMISRVVDAAGEVGHYVCSMVDLTSERVARASIDHMTFFDPVTDLPNRYFLHGRLQHMLDASTGTAGTLLLIDLDHFKRINDLRGHAVGDQLLALIAQRLHQSLDERCTLCRFGGGTFALLEGCGDGDRAEQAWACARQVRDAMRESFAVGTGAPVAVTVSIGWTRLNPGRATPDTALKQAELAMYSAKAGGRDQIRQFRSDMQADLQRRETLAHELRSAIADDRLDVHLQPQVDRACRITGAELLLRWSRPCGEAISPATFIPIAEESGLILALGDWVIDRACELLAGWAQHPRLGPMTLAVNVSARQFAQREFVDGIRQALVRTGADPKRLTLEITESVVLGDLPQAAAKLAQLQAQGIRIALDDFGTGYSSLTYLSRLPLDQLKIDQSFVAHLPEDASDAMVAQTIIAMGRGLGMEVIAEGVETGQQMDFLKAHACDAFQGYLIARPMPTSAFEALLEQRTTLA